MVLGHVRSEWGCPGVGGGDGLLQGPGCDKNSRMRNFWKSHWNAKFCWATWVAMVLRGTHETSGGNHRLLAGGVWGMAVVGRFSNSKF